jgi:hypothetical protein
MPRQFSFFLHPEQFVQFDSIHPKELEATQLIIETTSFYPDWLTGSHSELLLGDLPL